MQHSGLCVRHKAKLNLGCGEHVIFDTSLPSYFVDVTTLATDASNSKAI